MEPGDGKILTRRIYAIIAQTFPGDEAAQKLQPLTDRYFS
jgi:hypothetical protein